MPVYENIPLLDFEHVIKNYASCWKTVVLAGVAFGDPYTSIMPTAIQIGSSDTLEKRIAISRYPVLPKGLYMFKAIIWPTNAMRVFNQIINKETIDIEDIHISFRYFQFGRSALLGSDDYNYIYPEEIHENIDGWPKLFFEGAFENQAWLESEYKSIEKELQKSEYQFHTLYDASNHIIGYRTGGGYFSGRLSAALKIPLKLRAKVEGRKLIYSLSMPVSLQSLPLDIRYIAKSNKGERDVVLPIPSSKKENDQVSIASAVELDKDNEALEVVIRLDGNSVESCRISPTTEVIDKVHNETEPGLVRKAKSVEESMQLVLSTLASQREGEMSRVAMRNEELSKATGLIPSELNDAVEMLVNFGYVVWRRVLGTAPYNFFEVELTALGRYEHEKGSKTGASLAPVSGPVTGFMRPPYPIGSPYGFTDEDWEAVAEAKGKANELFVVLGRAFESEYYDAERLKVNVAEMFQRAVAQYNEKSDTIPVDLSFKALSAGYGEHLFNQIARDIISADIAVFDTSDLNPNVMIEMGVALTWGVRVLPIKQEGCEEPPSDISGQTWADYRDSASEFIDADHDNKLVRMVERAIQKKAFR